MNEFLELLKRELSLEGIELTQHKGFVEIKINRERLSDIARRLKELGLDHVKAVVAVDEMEQEKIRVSYIVSSFEKSHALVALTTEVSRDSPRLESLSLIWPSAELQEREVYELFGIVFEGHRDLRPLLLDPELANRKVMRRDFKIEI
ncbi:MAG: NADH-quinone oxidoreductase subunit C [Acidilobaceae archaeon]